MEVFGDIIGQIDSFVWSIWLLIPLLAGTGVLLTFRLRGVQFTKLWAALRLGLFARKDKDGEGDISHFQALTTALAATVGTGNIVGVATAIGAGGPGALFWMWVTGILGMASKYSEAFLGSKYRELDAKGQVMGGPQVYLKKAIKGPVGKFLGIIFAIFGALAAFGIGNGTQISSMTRNMEVAFGIDPLITGVIIMILTGLTLIGGIKSIGKVTAAFVPFMILLYIVAGIVVLAMNYQNILPAFGQVFYYAFADWSAPVGGALGTTVALAIQKGMARGIFSNESGMGSAAIVAAAAQTTHPVRQGLVSMTQTFIDTIIVVSFTGLVIISSGVWTAGPAEVAKQACSAITDNIPAWCTGGIEGFADNPDFQSWLSGIASSFQSNLTSTAFASTALGSFGPKIVAVCIVFFALSTVIGWAYYGERCAVSLLGIKVQLPYRIVFTAMIVVWVLFPVGVIWDIADILNGLMALPNLIGLLLLSGLIARETRKYLNQDPDLTQGGVGVEPLMALSFKGGKVSWVPAEETVARQ
ncbi:MAG: sodium:alanine symporter family protein [Propionibacteriaceae bacterium]|jgi:AGCS family alanine or glycine:cation symporter|nr:sodium:alanine symporter family protein [Propionibacteriaceae bacterium]